MHERGVVVNIDGKATYLVTYTPFQQVEGM